LTGSGWSETITGHEAESVRPSKTGETKMECSFCDAKKVKLKDIIIQGHPRKVCLACEEFDGVKGDGASK